MSLRDSPRPTVKTCSPFKPTPTPRRIEKAAETMRGGPHHCANPCALKLAKKKVNLKNAKRPRSAVAVELEDTYWSGENVGIA